MKFIHCFSFLARFSSMAFEENNKKFPVRKEIVEIKLLDEKNSLLKSDKSQPDVDEFADVKKRIEHFEVFQKGTSSKV